jgi:hypothetical protein
MGTACGTHGSGQKFCLESLKEKAYLEELGIGEKIILK